MVVSKRVFFIFLFVSLVSCTHKSLTVLPQAIDQNDCIGTVPSFTKDIQPVLKKSCAKSGCHDAVSMPHDYSVYSELKPVLEDSAFYYYVIKDRKMPEDGPLDTLSYKLIKCWVRNGFPDN